MLINSYNIKTFERDDEYIPFCIFYILNNKEFSFYWSANKDIVKDSIIAIFKNINENCIIYTHDLKYDASFIIYSLSNHSDFILSCLIEKKQVYELTIFFKENNKRIKFRCSYNLLPLSLENIAKGFNLGVEIDYPHKFIKIETLFWISNIPKNYFLTHEGWQVYNTTQNLKKFTINACRTNCILIKKFIELIHNIFWTSFKINILKKNILSASSLAFYIFYKKFNAKGVKKIIHKDEELYIRNAYYGGRCEVFGNPIKDNIYHFDFPGMYGLCMKEKNVFGVSKFIYELPSTAELLPGFYTIDWKSNMRFPILPHHNVISNKLFFTNGEGTGTYWFEEINFFKEQGGEILKIHSGLTYTKYDYTFLEFVNFFENFRKLNNTYKTFGKLMINSFYGRTGIKPRTEISFFIYSEIELESLLNLANEMKITIVTVEKINKIWFISLKINDYLKKIYKIKKDSQSNIAIAASITAKARIKLLKAIIEIEKNDGRALYCDTDSIIAEFFKNVDNKKHGEIFWNTNKLDTKISDAVFSLPKTYGILFENGNSLVKIKGVRRDYISFKDFKTSFYDNISIKVDNVQQIKNINFKIKKNNVNQIINLLAYDKRKFINNFKNTIPLIYLNGKYR